MRNHQIVFIISCFCLVSLMFYNYALPHILEKYIVSSLDLAKDIESENLDPMEKTLKRIRALRDFCGSLCDTTKTITPHEFIGTVTAKVDCKKLFESAVFYLPGDLPAQQWGVLPAELQNMYTFGGRVDVKEVFTNDAAGGEGRNVAKVFTKADMENYIEMCRNGESNKHWYADGTTIVGKAVDFVGAAGKTILVIGTQLPWVEAMLFSKGAKKVVTLEYGYFISEYPALSFVRPREFRELFLNGTLDVFDAVFTYSSLEHSGLGRYGDALNPWGDIMAVAEAWCASSKDAMIAMGVPTMVSKGLDINVFNQHRVYGPMMYPFLMTNWEFVWPTLDEDRITPDSVTKEEGEWKHQPFFVFKKNNGEFFG